MTSQLNLTDYGSKTGLVAWDTVSAAEWVAVAIGAAVCTLILCFCAIIFYKRSYAPMKAAQWPLLLISGIAGVTYWIGSVASYRVFPNTGPFLVYCGLFEFWMTDFALFLYIQVIIFRMMRLYWLLILKFQHTNLSFYGGFLLFCTVPLILAIVGTALNEDGPLVNRYGFPSCSLGEQFKIVFYVWIGLLALMMLFLSISLRNIPKKAFQEYKSNSLMCILFAVVYIIEVTMVEMTAQNYVWGRVFLIFLVLLSVSFPFFFIIGRIVYHSIVDPVQFEKQFWKDMNADIELFSRQELPKDAVASYSKDSSSPSMQRDVGLTLNNGALSKSAQQLLTRNSNEFYPRDSIEKDTGLTLNKGPLSESDRQLMTINSSEFYPRENIENA